MAAAARGGGGRVRIGSDLDDPVGALGRRGKERVVDVAEVQGHHGHGPAAGLLQQQRLLQGVVVRLVENERRGAQVEFRRRSGDFQGFDQVGDLAQHHRDVHQTLLSPKSMDSAKSSMMSRTLSLPSRPPTLAASSKRDSS